MAQKSVIIIGAGVAGLAAGCYARMNGYQTKIFELHSLPGGLCTAWERKDYIFDGCIHYLFGSGQGQPFYRMWEELGAVQNRPMINHSEYQRITDGRQTLIVYADPDRLQAHLLELSPADAPLIRAFCDGVRQFTRFDMAAMYQKPKALMGALDWRDFGMKMLPYIMPMLRWATLPAKHFAGRFQSPFLRRALAHIFSWEEAPMMMGMALLAYMHTGNAGFPAGGSLAFARAIEQRYLDLGGEIYYDAQVEKILTEDGRAVGVRLYNDDIHRADYVISAADAHNTIYNMLDGKYLNRKVERMFDGHLPTLSQVQISFGVQRDFSAEPHWVVHLLDKPLLMAGREYREIGLQHYSFDASLAPAGKSSLVVLLPSDYDYWQRIYGRKLYDTEQRQISDTLVDLLEKWYPGIRADIEVMDEATPLSYERYTGNWWGSTCGWLMMGETMPLLISGVDKTLPGLRNFYLAGQWVEPGGTVTLAAASGRSVVQLMCHADSKAFTATVP
ncbi:MAG: NAD(P)/FAD-dependent oxidoreductase [Chloroflexi bacterium]|nr:NAD(P)/FAD-dependent oxidoreductase [Chloroflexota bacterium]